MKTEIKKLPKSELEIEFELTPEEFQKHVEHALSHFKEHMKMDGFRQGQVPLKIVEERVGSENLLMEAGDHAVKHVYVDFIKENNLEPMGQPEVQITKIAKGSPFCFKAKITVLPEVELPDYKEIAKSVKGKEVSVTDQEAQDAINYLQKTRAKFSQKDGMAEKGDFVEIEYQSKDLDNNKLIKDKFILGEGGMIRGFEEAVTGMKAGEEKEFTLDLALARHNAAALGGGKDVIFRIKVIQVQKMELPEVSDEFAKQLGAFDSLVSLKKSIKEGIKTEKTESEKQRRRGEILDRISEKSKFEMPEKLVEYEQNRLLDELKQNINNNFKMSFENYLAAVKQTEDDLKKSFSKEAEQRIRRFLVLREIGKREFDNEQLKEYNEDVINEKIFNKLEECQ